MVSLGGRVQRCWVRTNRFQEVIGFPKGPTHCVIKHPGDERERVRERERKGRGEREREGGERERERERERGEGNTPP